jgi:tetratricopeptide (TPR) repeat protein
MRTLLVVAILLALPVAAVRAQVSQPGQIVEADRLRHDGQPQAAVAILEPLVDPESTAISQTDLGVAWNVLGSAYQDLKMPAKARACYGVAMDKLRPIASAQAQYAATLANLGALEDEQGQREAAKVLIEKANRIYEGLGDSGGSTITATSLAALAYRQKDFKASRRYIARASEQEARTTGLREDDLAALVSLQGAMAFHDGHYDESIARMQMAIDGWTRAHGPSFFMLGMAYSLRAEAIAKRGDYPRALDDVRHALAVVEASEGKNNVGYFRVQLVYAQILRASGEKEQASQLSKDASRSLSRLESRQCAGCTIDVSGFR